MQCHTPSTIGSPNGEAACTLTSCPRLQDLLSALADIDLAYECDLEFVRNSAANEDLKTVAIGNLQQLHHRRRAPIVRRLTALENRLRA